MVKVMQVYAAAASPVLTGIGVGTGSSKYTDLVNQYVSALATGSNASLDDKLNAYQNIESLLFTGDDNGGVLYQTNKNDWKRAADAYDNSDLTKQLQQINAQFNSAGLTAVHSSDDGSFNVAQNKLDNLARFSPDQQKMIFVSENLNVPGNSNEYYASVDAWKSALKTQATAFTTQQQQDAAATASAAADATAQTLSAITTNAQTAATTPTKPTATLTPQTAAPTSGASIALQVLISAQAEASTRATAADSAKKAAIYAAQNDDTPQTEATSAIGTQPTSAQQTTRLDQLA